jgi:hypothetical protein
MDTRVGHPKVQRLWRLLWLESPPSMECVGAIIDGPVENVTPADTWGIWAIASVAEREDIKEVRETLDGRRFYIADFVQPERPQGFAQQFATVDDALAWLDVKKQGLLDEGWIEASLDPIADPD